MSEVEQVVDKKVSPWQWPGEWFRDEKFWREVTARALSGIIVIFLGYWAALYLGYIRTPSALKTSYDVTVVAAAIVLFLLTLGRYIFIGTPYTVRRVTMALTRRLGWRPLPRRRGKSNALLRRARNWATSFIEVYILLVMYMVTVLIAYLVLWLLFSAINTVFDLNQPLPGL